MYPALSAHPPAKDHSRKEIRRCDANASIRRGEATLCLTDIRASSQQIDGLADGHFSRQRRDSTGFCQFFGEVLGKTAQQDRNYMATCIDLCGEWRLIGLQRRQFTLRQAYVDCVGQSAVEAPLREINVAARGSNILTEDDQLVLLRAHVEIGLRDVGGDC